jgi:hypothetical protein
MVGGVVGVVLGVVGVALGVAWGVAGGVAWGVAGGVAWGVVGGVVGVALGLAGVALGVASGVASGIGVIAVYFRLIPYALTLPLATASYLLARKSAGGDKPRPYDYYHLALLLFDELTFPPVPFLDRLLVLLAQADREAGLREITYIARDTPQGWAARAALVELARLDLLHLETMQEISQVGQKLAWMPTDPASLPGDAPEALRRLGAVGTEVAAALAPVSRRERDEHLAAARQEIDDLCRFAAVGLGTPLFIEVAEHWQGILTLQAYQLQAIPNPFVAGPPLTAGSPLFVGREDVLKQIADHLAAGRRTVAEALPKPALVLYGQRRMGKSSILLQLPVHLPEDYIPVYADLRGLAAQGTAGLLWGLAGVVSEAVAARGLTPPAVAPLEGFALEPFAVFNAFLDRVEVVIGNRRIAIFLDEFEWLQEKVDEGMISRDIFGYLASAIKLRPRLFLVFAGLHSLEQMRREYWTAFLYGNSVGIPVSYLAEAEAERLLAMLPVEMPPKVRQRIIQATGCQPYLLQVVCYRLVEYLNAKEPPPEQASVRDVTTVLDLILEKGEADYYFEDYVWRYSNQAEREVLVALARPGGMQEGQLLQEEALRSLERREILTQLRDGTWRYRVELVRRWVARKARKATTTEV